MELATQIKQWRADNEYGKLQTARLLKVSPRTLQLWESGERSPVFAHLVVLNRAGVDIIGCLEAATEAPA